MEGLIADGLDPLSIICNRGLAKGLKVFRRRHLLLHPPLDLVRAFQLDRREGVAD